MSDVRFRPRSASEIVDAAFQLYRRNAQDYVLVTALAYAPWLVVQLVLLGTGLTDPARLMTTGVSGPAALGSAALGVGIMVAFTLMSAIVVRYGAERYHGRAADLGTVVREVLPRLPALLVAGILKSLAIGGGALLFLVGAFYFAARFFAVVQAIVVEGCGVGAAFGRSSALSGGRKGHVLGTLALVYLIYFVASIAASMVGGVTGSLVAQAVVSAVFTIVAYPIVGLTEMLLYYDARIRAEGYDIEVMARSLGGVPDGAAAPHGGVAP